jgi:UDP-N-acetylmuramyl pentapeptide synthase
MHRNSGLQTSRGSHKVAVLDTIHGATIIAKRMVKAGIEAEALEVYHHAPSLASYDLVVAPIHLGPNNQALAEAKLLRKRIITHHQAVGKLVQPCLPVFEVTGTHSKTSTALLLAKILSGKGKAISHTTRGIELWSGGSSRLVQSGLSITPGSVICAVETAETYQVDALVCEVSLGGTGLADYGILTSFVGDYRIAQGTTWASTAKLQMVSLAKRGARLVANVDVRISPEVSFGPVGDIRTAPDRIYFGNEFIDVELGQDLDFAGYDTAISAAVAACYSARVSPEEIAAGLEGFDGFSGRMKIIHDQGREILDNSNSGLKASDVGRALDRFGGRRLGLVVGEESETVCEGMDVHKLIELLKQRREEIDLLILVGSRLHPWAEELGANTAPDLATGTDLARAANGFDRLLLCVKCFR